MSKLLPVGAQTNSKAPSRYPKGSPRWAISADGAWVTCDDRGLPTRYVDAVNGMGSVILGHNHPTVEHAVHTSRGNQMPLPMQLEEDAAWALLRCLGWSGAESVRFGKNGADVTGAAVRLARAATGRADVACFEGCYHGHHDWSMGAPPMNGGVPAAVRLLTHKVPWMDLALLEEVFQHFEPACLVAEPAQVSLPHVIPTEEEWAAVRGLCDRHGVLLVLDEMVTGFRVAIGGGAEHWGIRPDLACYGKAMGNGYPISALVGPWDLMKRFEENVFFSTTHGGERIGLAAAIATLSTVRYADIPAQLAELRADLVAAVLKAAPDAPSSWPVGYPGRLVFPDFSAEQSEEMVRSRVLFQGYVNLSLAHYHDSEARETLKRALVKAAALATEVDVAVR